MRGLSIGFSWQKRTGRDIYAAAWLQGDRQGEVKQYAVSGLGDVIAEQRSRSAYAWEGHFDMEPSWYFL